MTAALTVEVVGPPGHRVIAVSWQGRLGALVFCDGADDATVVAVREKIHANHGDMPGVLVLDPARPDASTFVVRLLNRKVPA